MFTQGMMLGGGAGGGSLQVAISNQSIFDNVPGFAVARYNLRGTGAARSYTENSGYANIPGEWRLSGASADYEVRWTLNSGDSPTILSGPAVGAWGTLNLGAEIQLSALSGTLECEIFCEIRRVSDSVVLDSATITLSVAAS